jgi:RNA polymerase sigma-70 factor (ECF subfamily)
MDDTEQNSRADMLSRVCKGDEQAFTFLFNTYKDKLYSFIYGITQNEEEALDVVQNVFLKIWQDRDHLPRVENVDAYLFTVAQHHALDGLRRYARFRLYCDEQSKAENDGTRTPYDELVAKEVNEKYREALNQLTPQQRKIFEMHHQQGLSFAQIAKQLDLSLSTVQNHSFRAMESIRKYLATYHPCILLLLLFGTFR